MKNQKDLSWIKGFSKINIKGICEELKIDRSNLLAGRTTNQNEKLVKRAIEERLRELDSEK